MGSLLHAGQLIVPSLAKSAHYAKLYALPRAVSAVLPCSHCCHMPTPSCPSSPTNIPPPQSGSAGAAV